MKRDRGHSASTSSPISKPACVYRFKVIKDRCSYRIRGDGELVEKANKYLEACELNNMSFATAGTYAYCLVDFFRWIDGDWPKFEAFNQKDLQDWMHHLQKPKKRPKEKEKLLHPRTINQRLCCVRAFYRFCLGKNLPHAAGVLYPKAYYKGAPRDRLGIARRERKAFLELKLKVPHRVMDPLKPQEIDTFLKDILRYRDLAIVLTMLLCGLRRQEVVNLRLEDVNFHQSCLRVLGKGNKERMIPLPFHLMQVYERYLEVERPITASGNFFILLQGKKAGQAMTVAGIRSLFRKRRVRLGIKKAKPHQFRHAFASDLARVGVPLTSIQKLMGHSDPRMSLIYIELFLDDIKADYDKAMARIKERYAALSK